LHIGVGPAVCSCSTLSQSTDLKKGCYFISSIPVLPIRRLGCTKQMINSKYCWSYHNNLFVYINFQQVSYEILCFWANFRVDLYFFLHTTVDLFHFITRKKCWLSMKQFIDCHAKTPNIGLFIVSVFCVRMSKEKQNLNKIGKKVNNS